MYKKARKGEIKNFTGISSPYEPPTNPEIHLTGLEEVTIIMKIVYKIIWSMNETDVYWPVIL